jgi:hypothetical protein
LARILNPVGKSGGLFIVRDLAITHGYAPHGQLQYESGKGRAKLRLLILFWVEADSLPLLYKDHSLSGNWKHRRERRHRTGLLLRTGTQSDLF